jgi:hypothetical protein
MIILDDIFLIFRVKNVFFADRPREIEGCDVLTFHCCRDAGPVEGFTRQDCLTSIIDLNQDREVLWRNIDRKSCRSCINRALKNDIPVLIDGGYEKFYELNRNFVKQKGFREPFDFNIPTVENMKKYGRLFSTELNGEIIAGNLYLDEGSRMRLWVSASRRLESDRETARMIGDANRLLHWRAIEYAKERGMTEFDWGGLWSDEKAAGDPAKMAINNFKLSFGGTVAPGVNYQKVYTRLYRYSRGFFQRTRPLFGQQST